MKKKFFKKIAKVVMTIGVAGMLINVGACGVNESAGEGIEPVYEDNDSLVLPVTAFWAPPPTEEYFSDLKDCGFTHVYIENKFGKPGSSGFLQAINLCEKHGIKAIPQTQWVDGVKQSYKDDPTDYHNYSCYAGHNIWDEPSAADFPKIAEEYESYAKDYPDATFFTNLFPSYASLDQLGTESYAEYVKKYVDEVLSLIKTNKTISVDFYPLMSSSGRKFIHSQYLMNLDILCDEAYKNGITPYVFIQDMGFGSKWRNPSTGDLSFQTYTALAFGIKGIQHFTYYTPPIGHEFSAEQVALIDRRGQKTALWNEAKRINDEVHAFDHVYLSFGWKGVKTIPGEEYCEYNFSGLRREIESGRIVSAKASADTVIGLFCDDKNRDGFCMVNFTDPSAKVNDKIIVGFQSATKAVVYARGEKSIVELNNGVFNYEIPCGEGVFVIPF